jgi:hypothetical protein
MRWLLLITGPMLVSCGVATAQPLTDGNSSDLQQIGDNNDIDVKQTSADAAANIAGALQIGNNHQVSLEQDATGTSKNNDAFIHAILNRNSVSVT